MPKTKGHRMIILSSVVTSTIVLLLYQTLFSRRNSIEFQECGLDCLRHDTKPFILTTPGCTIPDFDPMHPSVAKFRVKKPKNYTCSRRRPLTEARGLSLVLHRGRAEEYGVLEEQLMCEYQGIVRVEQNPDNFTMDCDKKFSLKEKVLLTDAITTIDEDGVFVTCHSNVRKLYETVHYFLQPRRSEAKRKLFQEKYGGQRGDMLSVLIMGIDSVSRANMRRNMPKTFHFLKDELGALDFQAFNKVADNTNPNMAASLMGLTEKELTETCQPKRTKFDDCPLIWKNFSDAGYITVYGEDDPYSGSFHYNRYGFLKEPTDFYNRPYMLVSHSYTRHNAGKKGSFVLCLGGEKSISVIHDYSLAVADTFRDTPYIAYYWNTGITHDEVEWASATDVPSLEYLRKLNESGVLDHTILFFISDHGIRFGDIRQTYAGLLEERLPYFFVLFPPWFREKYPEAWKSLSTNTKRLVSNFDFHVTLNDILVRGYENDTKSLPAILHGQSLFKEIPDSRSCEDATIPEHYCTCERSQQVEAGHPRLRKAAEFVVNQLNYGMAVFPECIQLRVSEVIRGRMGQSRKSVRPNEAPKTNTISVTFTTLPGKAAMEATVRQYQENFELTADVSRINKYGNQSHCISDPFYARYCYCRDLLPSVFPTIYA
ncbi:uncharacterized protein LOC122267820 isoform X1 [Penaeus japonicus]|uniref:uncharacterized protein LOC122267820 isoform X1 n=1 Tax=Penaeus japonicus TaxID=27405 RepID=UPI001C70F48D|nr:uncharacterized protein LOC122267820 isoform X1 [Penaeus japonicus]XP_042893917.1 uncharacterized protein LOC122267820 isoform X1 [Penaeus japonicus]XP_042893918.1 uncharacterized protein LOC122267820 isoform X1 [Penaeus japonicus]XP_042893919.1 uncharacterized protein LOC122267820 isoform X1 [Penaeus japonicus]